MSNIEKIATKKAMKLMKELMCVIVDTLETDPEFSDNLVMEVAFNRGGISALSVHTKKNLKKVVDKPLK